MTARNRFAGVIGWVCVVCFGAGLGIAHGGTRNWTGAVNASWATPGNWSPAGVPQNGDDLIFAIGGTSSNNLSGLQVRTLTFKAGHTIVGNAIALTNGISSLGPGVGTIDVPVTVSADQTWASTQPFAVYQPIALNDHTLTLGGVSSFATTRAPTGNGAIVKIGAGSWNASAVTEDANVGFTGPITIQQGRMWVNGANAFGREDGTDANGTTVMAGASIRFTSMLTGSHEAITVYGTGGGTSPSLLFDEAGTQRFAGTLTLATSAALTTVASGFSFSTIIFTDTSRITGPGDLTILDNSTVIFESNLNTFGRVRFGGSANGVLRMGNSNALTATGGIDLAPAAQLQMNGFDTSLPWLGGSGTVTNGAAPPASLYVDAMTDCTFTGTLLNVYSLVKRGSAEFVFGGTSGSAGIVVMGGAMRVTSASAFGTGPAGTVITAQGRLVLDGVSPGTESIALQAYIPPNAPTLHVTAAAPVTIGGSVTIDAGANAVFSGAAGSSLTITGQIAAGGDLRIAGVTLHAANNTNVFAAGTVTVDADAVFDIAAQGAFGSTPTKGLHVMGAVTSGSTSVVVNSLTGTGTLSTAANAYLEVAPAGTSVFAGVISGGPTLVKNAAGTLRLTGTAALGWATTDGGELAIGSQQITSPHLIVNPGATLAWDVPMTHAGDLSTSDTGSGTGASTLVIRGGNVTLTGTSSFMNPSNYAHVTGAHQLVLRNSVGGRSLVAYGTGVTILDQTFNFLQQIVAGRDETPAGSGTVRLARSNALDHSGGLRPTGVGVEAGSTFDMAGFSQRLVAVGGTGRIDTGTASGVLTLDGASAVFDGTFAGPGRIVANVAPAVYALKGTQPLTGTFESNASLDVAANLAMPAGVIARGANVTIASGASFGPLTLEGAAEYLRIGSDASAGGITTSGLTLPAGATTKVWLTAPTPRIAVNGSVHLAGGFAFSTSTLLPLPSTANVGVGGEGGAGGAGGVDSAAAVLTIIENDGTDPIVGTFETHPEGMRLTIGGVEYRVSYTGGTGNDMTLIPVSATLMTYHLAEGATGTFFDTDLLIANPTDRGVLADVTFLPENGAPIVQQHFVYAMSRLTLKLDDVAGLESGSFSTIVAPREDVPLIVERTMRWDASGYGGHTEKATEGPALTWYFAEGSEGFFRTFLLLANPHADANVAHVQYLREGLTPITRSYDLLPSSRRTIAAGDDQELINQSFGMIVTFDRPGVAERAMYFGTSPIFRGGHESAGVTAPSASWLLAEGATGAGFDTFILVANPGSEAADVTFTFLPENGTPVSVTRRVEAASRITVNPESEPDVAAAGLPLGPVATQIAATKPVIAERAQYWPLGPSDWTEAHNSFGVTDAASKWGLAEGRAGGPESYQTYILLANPGTSDAKVTLTFLGDRDAATPAAKIVDVPAQRRVNVAVDPTGAAGDPATTFGTLITSDRPIVVERAMYWNVNGEVWAAGTNATATRLP